MQNVTFSALQLLVTAVIIGVAVAVGLAAYRFTRARVTG